VGVRDLTTAARLAVLAVAMLIAAAPAAGSTPRGTRTMDPRIVESMVAQGYVFVRHRVAALPDGRPRLFFVRDLRRGSGLHVEAPVRESIERTVMQVKPRYRDDLAFFFADLYDKQYLVVFIPSSPQWPVLNLCVADPEGHCRRSCPYFVHPRSLIIMPSTMQACADTLPVWR
jgi:hypothetical protein